MSLLSHCTQYSTRYTRFQEYKMHKDMLYYSCILPIDYALFIVYNEDVIKGERP